MKSFLTKEEEQVLVDEIHQAELSTSGEIRIVISSRWWVFRPWHYARKVFVRNGMQRTKDRNAALILLLVRNRRFVIMGDRGFESLVAPSYWQDLADRLSELLRDGQRMDALTSVIRTLGETMASHWPSKGGNPNELPDTLITE